MSRHTTVLVTGAAGFAGSHLLDVLLARDCRVVGLRRPGIGAEVQARYPQVEWLEIELLDRDVVRHTLVGIAPNVLYHLAGAPHAGQSWGNSTDTLAINVLATHHVLEGIRVAGLQTRVIIPSSAYVYRPANHALREDDPIEPVNPYAISKIATELAARRATIHDGIPVVVARSFNHLGPRQASSFFGSAVARQIAQIEAGRLEPVIRVGNLDARRDFTDVRDTVRAYVALAERGVPGRIYNVCSGQARVVRELLDGLTALSRVPVTVQPDPDRFRPNDTPLLLGNPSRITSEIGWRPEIPFGQTLQDLLDYWRQAL
ncbi:MAG: GDP-mannose 4,6-dehydratase [Acidobacteria bacterium]|nr:GDP-mannose 4,6-dehydratase [Acidobacteriota bacterium]